MSRSPSSQAFDRRLLSPILLGAILNPINSSIIAVALAPIGIAFGAPASQTAWLISALYLSTAIGQPLSGRLVDTFGPKALFLVGAMLTGVAGIAGMLAPNIDFLIMARVILGFGTCAGYPAAMYLIRSEAQRTGMRSPTGVLTALAITTQTVAVIGPTLGGILIDLGGWRATFAVNIPLGVACLVLGSLFLPANTALEANQKTGPGKIDTVGIFLFAATLVALLLYLMNLHVSLLWLLGIAIAAGTVFTLWEVRREDPFIDVRVFVGNFPLLGTYARTVLAYTVSYTFIYGFTLWLEESRHLSASVAGLILLPTFGIGILVSSLTGRRNEVRAKLLVGAVAQLVVCGTLLALDDGTSIWLLLVITAILGVPQGLISLANQNGLYHQADPERMGASAGLLRTFTYLGAMIASAATGSFFGQRATTSGLHGLAMFMLAVAAAFLAITLFDRSLGHIGHNNPEPDATTAATPTPARSQVSLR